MGFDVELLLLALGPVFVLFIGAEALYYRKHGILGQRFCLRDSLCNLALALLHQGADKIAWLLVLPLYQAVYQHRLFTFDASWGSFLVLFLAQDFLYYWFHRASHRVRWLWAAHSVHHSSRLMNFSTAFRQSLMYPVAGMWAFWLPIAWLGFPPGQVVAIVLLNLAYQFFVHTQAIPKLGVLEWVLNTPSIHRSHHAKNPRYIDHNYAGVLVIWDRMFGTYVEETADDPCDYGTVKPVNSFNPFWVSLVEWRDMLVHAWRAPTLKGKLIQLFAPPERAERDTLPDLRDPDTAPDPR
ncbi:sterol desaturase family protein [Paludibacterium paludis]|uniref:Fatty acid hydroxylase domain-containing protein n=1 Tax=Paludibacterium paludis TaxID=1225769 RepID=A0A918P002_9NEIS|nr:sterol desaturase family protein [Paludibacterium paludis]GGY09199.1 hypothetical protein GCM10011289_09920 [Paludibacterium paludis]